MLWGGQQPISHLEVSSEEQGPEDITQAGCWVEGKSFTHLQRDPGLAVPCGMCWPVPTPCPWHLHVTGPWLPWVEAVVRLLGPAPATSQSLGTRDCLPCLRSLTLYPQGPGWTPRP